MRARTREDRPRGPVLVELQARRRAPEQAGKRGLAYGERLTPEIVAVELHQVERIEEHARVVPPVANAVEGREPVVPTCHRLAVNDA
jgi:hypothetical protein